MSSEAKDSPQERPIIPVNCLEIVSVDGEIVLKEYTIEDAEEAFALIDRNREFLSRYGEDTSSKYPDLESFRQSILHPKNLKRMRFAIVNKEDVIVGSINLTPTGAIPKVGEIGYYRGEEFGKHGYATRAVAALTSYAFSHGYERLFGRVVPDNKPSLGVLEANGYKETTRDPQGKIILTRRIS
jgi:RimJ/RimL family protein N-acetyltransferase